MKIQADGSLGGKEGGRAGARVPVNDSKKRYTASVPSRLDVAQVVLFCCITKKDTEQIQDSTPKFPSSVRSERKWVWDGLQEVKLKAVRN